MSNFITRIELHQAKSPDDYNQLHSAMLSEGFSHLINSDNGNIYELPTAEYYKNTSSSIEDVYNSASLAANTTGKSFWVLITEWTRAKWKLQEVKKPL